MPPRFDPEFVLNIAGTFLAFGALTALYIWPAMRKLPRYETLKILLLPHAFRFLGLAFLFPGVVSPDIPSEFATPAAWGDFGAAVLALISIVALTRGMAFAIPMVWLFNLWGTTDLLYAYYQGITLEVEPGSFGAAYFIATMIVPPLPVLHALTFVVLLRGEPAGLLGERPGTGSSRVSMPD